MNITKSGVYADITELQDKLTVEHGVTASFPNLTSIGGNVWVSANGKLTVPNLTSIGGGVWVRNNGTLTVPNLTSIGEYVDVHENAKLTVPNLTSIGEYVYVYENGKLTVPNLTSIGKYVDVHENAKLTVPNLTSIGKHVYVHENAKLTVPNLASIGGDVDVHENAKLTVPNLSSIGGDVWVSANGKLTVPNLTSIGGDVDVHENAKLTRSETTIPYERSMLEASFNASGYTFLDDILAKIVHRRGNVMRVVIAGQTSESYLVTDGKFHAHGATLKQANNDLAFKRIAEKIKNDPIKKDTVITIPYYRTLTGACETGINHWMAQTFDVDKIADILENGITAETLLPILKDKQAYGFEKFQQLVTF